MSIGSKMDELGLTSGELARMSGVELRHLSAYKCGSRTMGPKAACKLAAVLGESPESLRAGNRLAVARRAERRGDAAAVLGATRQALEIGHPEDDEIRGLRENAGRMLRGLKMHRQRAHDLAADPEIDTDFVASVLPEYFDGRG